jgi:hypothetical protein
LRVFLFIVPFATFHRRTAVMAHPTDKKTPNTAVESPSAPQPPSGARLTIEEGEAPRITAGMMKVICCTPPDCHTGGCDVDPVPGCQCYPG